MLFKKKYLFFLVFMAQARAAVVPYSTYIGGDDVDAISDMALDAQSNIYLTGYTRSSGLATPNVVQTNRGGGNDAFIMKFDSTGSNLIYATYLGGTNQDYGLSIAADDAGNAYVVGGTESLNFPVTNAIYSSKRGGGDAFVAKIGPMGTNFIFSTYYGGTTNDWGEGIAIDSCGRWGGCGRKNCFWSDV